MKCEPCISVGEAQIARIADCAPYARYWELRLDLSPELMADPGTKGAEVRAALRSVPQGVVAYKGLLVGDEGAFLANFHRVVDPLLAMGFSILDLDTSVLAHLMVDKSSAYPIHRVLRIPTSVRLIASKHFAEYAPQRVPNLVAMSRQLGAAWGKVVFPCSDAQQCQEIIDFQRHYAGMIFLGMGLAGQRTRVECVEHGAPFSYVHLGRPTAPGQLSLQEYLVATRGQGDSDSARRGVGA